MEHMKQMKQYRPCPLTFPDQKFRHQTMDGPLVQQPNPNHGRVLHAGRMVVFTDGVGQQRGNVQTQHFSRRQIHASSKSRGFPQQDRHGG
jgi:hypothetical protein